ncbi:MAG: DUF1294 domain-containing protein [Clostridia bacterium]|nr:DUF1294 domain-containing protein [Clostridia bacterium]
MELYQYFLIYIATLSFVTYLIYTIDKAKAQKGKWRISEKALLTLSIIGGASGGLLAMFSIRHKTKHWYFVVINVLSAIIHLLITLYLLNFAWLCHNV